MPSDDDPINIQVQHVRQQLDHDIERDSSAPQWIPDDLRHKNYGGDFQLNKLPGGAGETVQTHARTIRGPVDAFTWCA